MPVEAGDILKAVNTYRNSSEFLALKRRWDTDYDSFVLKPYDAGKKYYSYTSNAPRILATKCINMLTDAKLIIRYPDDALNREEREVANNNERLCYGVLNLNDDWLVRQGYPTLRNQKAWHAIIRGQYGLNIYVYKDEDGNTRPEVRIWDAYNSAYEPGKYGAKWAVRTRSATREQIKQEYNIVIAAKSAIVYDWWDEENNAVLIGKSDWGKPPTPHGRKYTPVFFLKAGATPPIERYNFVDSTQDEGESVFAQNRNIYPLINKTMSDRLTIIRRGVMVPLGIWSAGGQKTLDTDIWQVEDGTVVPLDSDRGEKVAPLIEPTMPPDTDAALNFISGEEQRGGLSYVAQGDVGFRLSGFAINQIQAAMATIITPFVEVLQRSYTLTCQELLNQYADKPWKPVEVRGRTSKNQPFGMPKPIKISNKDIEPSWRPEIELSPIFPKDDAQRYELARLATQGERPLLSARTAREELIGVEDADLEDEKISQEWSDSLPIMKLLKSFQAALADKDYVRAQTLAAQVSQALGSAAQPTGGTGTQALNTPRQLSMFNPGMGAASGQTGVSASTMPPEMMGGAPAGAANARGA